MGTRPIKLVLLLAMLLAFPLTARAAPRVVTSIKPLHSLAAGIMEGVAEPDVLLKGAGSPHTYSLKPSDAEVLDAADVIFWIGPVFEAFLEKPLKALNESHRIYAITEAAGLNLLSHDSHSEVHAPATFRADGHVWLDPMRAKIIARYMADVLIAVDPDHADVYRRNVAQISLRLDELDARVRQQLAPVASKPYVVLHDAYRYFEGRYGLRHMGAVTVSPERPPGARRVLEIRAQIKASKAICIFGEPQFEPTLIRSLFSESNTRFGVLDPEGSTLAPGPDLVFNLLQALADNFVMCLTPS